MCNLCMQYARVNAYAYTCNCAAHTILQKENLQAEKKPEMLKSEIERLKVNRYQWLHNDLLNKNFWSTEKKHFEVTSLQAEALTYTAHAITYEQKHILSLPLSLSLSVNYKHKHSHIHAHTHVLAHEITHTYTNTLSLSFAVS